MRLVALFIAVSLSLLLCVAAVCQNAPPPAPPTQAPPPAPTMTAPAPQPGPAHGPVNAPAQGRTPWLLQRGNPYVIVGPADFLGKPRMIAGKITVVTRPDIKMKVTSVAVQVDDKPIGAASGDRMGLYGLEFDTTTLTDGPHTIKSLGADASGKQVWTANTPVEVHNKRAEVPGPGGLPYPKVTQPTPPTSAPIVKITPITKTASAKLPAKTAVKHAHPVAVAKAAAKAAPVVAAPSKLGKAFASAKYGFSIEQPSGWIAKDKTPAMKPKQAGNGWIEFSPTKDAGLVVNVRRMRLAPATTADVFAKFNPYVTKWDKKTVLGADAFSTNTDTGTKIIHRLIIVESGYAWMLNCVDANGKSSGAGQKVFDSMVASFSLSPRPVAKSAPKHAVKVAVKPAVKQAAQPMARPAAITSAKPIAKPVTKMAPKPAAVPAPAKAPKKP